MYSTSKTIVAAVNIPILKINNFTFMWLQLNEYYIKNFPQGCTTFYSVPDKTLL
jgi:hypothetical protein